MSINAENTPQALNAGGTEEFSGLEAGSGGYFDCPELLSAQGGPLPAAGPQVTADRSLTAAAEAARRIEPILDTDQTGGVHRLEDALRNNEPATESSVPPQSFAIADDPELLADFVMEAREHLTSIEANLLSLEKSGNTEAVHSVFRSFHTIKGLAGFLELREIRDVAHDVETLLDLARQSKLRITPEVVDAILQSRDYLSGWMTHLEQGYGHPVPRELSDPAALLAKIQQVLGPPQPEIEISGQQTAVLPPPEAALLELEDAGAQATEQSPISQTATRSSGSVRSIKVDTAKLDYLVDMVGEMVIAQSVIRQDSDLTALKSPRLTRNLTQLARITDEVQRTTMSMRMVPIGPLFHKMSRLVRDLTRRFGKQAELDLVGEEVELDRNIVEELADPLMHMVRNAVDHGVEAPERRLAAGKDPVARIQLKAFHMAGQIVVQIADDGKGLDKARILDKARRKGLISENAILSESDCFNLIFEPGFSTAEKLSDISGRGVGMDVVKRQIQKLRGTSEIQSTPGQGTTFSLKLPLTMAIIDGLVVLVGVERYIIPIYAVREIFRPKPNMVSTIENHSEMVLLRDQLLPVIRLGDRFGIHQKYREPHEAVMIVVERDGKPFGLMVDELVGKQEVVIRSLGPIFNRVRGIAGGAILGDGRIGLILDLEGVFKKFADA